jgi:uncharacterized protein YdaU (DUF1376 family)
MAEHPILPLAVAYLIADTSHMNNEEFGAYMRILCAMWMNGGRIRECDLEKISQLSRYKFAKYLPKISRLLTFAGGEVSQKRLTDTWLRVKENSRKATEAVNRRWEREGAIRPYVHPNVRTKYERNTTIKEERKTSLSSDVPQSAAAPPQEASVAASKSHPLQASPELVANMQRAAKRGFR